MKSIRRLKALISIEKYSYFLGQNSWVSVALYYSTASFTSLSLPQGLSVRIEASLGGEVFFSFASNPLFAFCISSLCLTSQLFRAVWPQELGLVKKKKNQGVLALGLGEGWQCGRLWQMSITECNCFLHWSSEEGPRQLLPQARVGKWQQPLWYLLFWA